MTLLTMFAAFEKTMAQDSLNFSTMKKQTAHYKMNTGVVTAKLAETKAFYQNIFNFGVTFENDWYLLLHTPDSAFQISFLAPERPEQNPIFRNAFTGKGMYITLEVDDVDAEYDRVKKAGATIAVELRDEPWGDRHFAVLDPNGIGIDVVKYTQPGQ